MLSGLRVLTDIRFNSYVVRTYEISMPQVCRCESMYMVVLNVTIDKKGHITAIKSEENSKV